MKHLIALLILGILGACSNEQSSSQGENFTASVNQVAETSIDDSALLTFFDEPTKMFVCLKMLPSPW